MNPHDSPAIGPRDLPALVADLNRHLGFAEEHLHPALRELEPIAPPPDRPGGPAAGTLFENLVAAVDRAIAVARLAEQVAARVGYCPPKSGETCCDAPLAKGFR